MDPVMRSLLWSGGLVVAALALIGLAVAAVLALRRRFTANEDGAMVTTTAQPDWIGLLTALQADRVPAKEWIALAPKLTVQAASCPLVLRAPLVAALDAALTRTSDLMAVASMRQVRAVLAAQAGT